MNKAIYWGIGILIAGALISMSTVSTTSRNGVTDCFGLDYARILFGGIAVVIGLSQLRTKLVAGLAIAVAGAAMVAYGLDLFGSICG